METLGLVLIIVGGIITVIGGIRLIIAMFRKSILWGLGGLLTFPFIMLIWTLCNWSDAKGPFLNYLAGIVFLIVGVIIVGPDNLDL